MVVCDLGHLCMLLIDNPTQIFIRYFFFFLHFPLLLFISSLTNPSLARPWLLFLSISFFFIDRSLSLSSSLQLSLRLLLLFLQLGLVGYFFLFFRDLEKETVDLLWELVKNNNNNNGPPPPSVSPPHSYVEVKKEKRAYSGVL